MGFTKKFKLASFITAGILILSLAAFITTGGITLSPEYSADSVKAVGLMRDTLICISGALVLLFGLLVLRSKLPAGAAGAIAILTNTAIVAALTFALRLPVDGSFLAIMLFVLGLTAYNTIMFFDRLKEELAADQQADKHRPQIANTTTRELLPRLIGPAIIIALIGALMCLLGGTSMFVFAIPVVIASLICTFTAVFLIPGIWVRLQPARIIPVKKSANKTSKKK